MDSIENRLAKLDAKVSALHQLTGRLEERILEILAHLKAGSSSSFSGQLDATSADGSSARSLRHSYQSYGIDDNLNHKDFLIDDSFQESSSASVEHHNLSPETQMRRLTAQLTAAYNRIAALEEQLLANRVY